MKYVKMLGLLGVAAATLMAFAGPASATTVTGVNNVPLVVGDTIHAEAEGHVTLHPPIGDITCAKSTVHGTIGNAGSSTTTVSGAISTLTFGECNAEVVVLNSGSLEIHTRSAITDESGTLTSKGARVTVTFNGFHCIFETAATGTDIGTLTGAANTKSTPTLDIEATIPRVGGTSGFFCGSTAQWTGSYGVNTPDVLNIH